MNFQLALQKLYTQNNIDHNVKMFKPKNYSQWMQYKCVTKLNLTFSAQLYFCQVNEQRRSTQYSSNNSKWNFCIWQDSFIFLLTSKQLGCYFLSITSALSFLLPKNDHCSSWRCNVVRIVSKLWLFLKQHAPKEEQCCDESWTFTWKWKTWICTNVIILNVRFLLYC